MQLGDAGLRLIAEFEGFRSHPYLDVVGIPTIGYGNTYYPDTGRRVTLADAPVTEREAADMLLATLARYVDGIDRYAQVPLTQNQCSLPHRQLRKYADAIRGQAGCSLPHRQLRK